MGLRNRSQLKHKRCFFVTTTRNHWYHIFDSPPFFELISSINFVAGKYNAEILGYVIMPNHLHFIIIFNEEENQLSNFPVVLGLLTLHWRFVSRMPLNKRGC
jgi:REP element-mobilizing transposase RayT